MYIAHFFSSEWEEVRRSYFSLRLERFGSMNRFMNVDCRLTNTFTCIQITFIDIKCDCVKCCDKLTFKSGKIKKVFTFIHVTVMTTDVHWDIRVRRELIT